MSQIFSGITSWYLEHINYATVTALMAIESSFIPFPSEIVVPPAAYKAAQGDLNFGLVILFATIGALIGALFNYFFALKLGRPVIYKLADTRFAHAMLVTSEGVEKAESFFLKYGIPSTLIGRMLPAIRQLISLPAGLARMKLAPFILFTTIGASIWNLILAILGYYMYSQKELLEKYYSELSAGAVVLGVLFFVFLLWNGLRPEKKVS